MLMVVIIKIKKYTMGATNANTPNVPGSTDGKPFLVKDVNVESPGVYSASRPVQSGGQLASVNLSVKDVNDWNGGLLKEDLVVDYQRGNIEKIFINNYVRTDRSHGFRALMVMEDHSLLLVQQGEIVWSREDGLTSVVDVTTS
ncbi:hypothetical protein RYX36_030430 [Vicia faba]